MDWVDLILIVLVLAAAVHGIRLGALVQVFSFGGFWLGLTVGALIAIPVVGTLHSTTTKTVATLFLVFGFALVFGVLGRVLGTWSFALARRHHLGPVDSGLGLGIAVGAVLLSAWLVGSLLAQTPSTWLSSQIQRSSILRGVQDVMPPVPDVFTHVQSFLASSGFPSVFLDLAPPPASPVGTPSATEAETIAGPAAASTVKILGDACGYELEGSGFVAGPGLVVTNAHVVAGEPSTMVVSGGSSYPASVVLFDPNLDVAVLRTSAPLGPPLQLDASLTGRGAQGAVLGYPENHQLTIGPAGVAASLSAQGRNIYNQGSVTRQVYQIDANVEPGNSGGPVVGSSGTVVGVVFSRSTVDPGVGYALASPAVLTEVQRAEATTGSVSTGACAQG